MVYNRFGLLKVGYRGIGKWTKGIRILLKELFIYNRYKYRDFIELGNYIRGI